MEDEDDPPDELDELEVDEDEALELEEEPDEDELEEPELDELPELELDPLLELLDPLLELDVIGVGVSGVSPAQPTSRAPAAIDAAPDNNNRN